MISFGGHTATGGGVMLDSKESMFVTIPSTKSIIITVFAAVDILVLVYSHCSEPLSNLRKSGFPSKWLTSSWDIPLCTFIIVLLVVKLQLMTKVQMVNANNVCFNLLIFCFLFVTKISWEKVYSSIFSPIYFRDFPTAYMVILLRTEIY